ncbi:unnamed protein product [Rotaria magnacalcarata]|uniref:Uncharacterized protein n=1 Tax=Rotaria magnacalcarata TaxID=392030 RepID=A0A815QFW6_9BILA|nr:unnamed protein product [Rotaria magnacalcarata]CAF4867247.1 unnamed protein product [Rotaria magnacalcarata]
MIAAVRHLVTSSSGLTIRSVVIFLTVVEDTVSVDVAKISEAVVVDREDVVFVLPTVVVVLVVVLPKTGGVVVEDPNTGGVVVAIISG